MPAVLTVANLCLIADNWRTFFASRRPRLYDTEKFTSPESPYIGLAILKSCKIHSGVEPSLEVRSAAEAKDVSLDYLRENDSQNAPSSDIVWQEEDITPKDWVGGVFKEFTSDEWTVKVSYPVLLPENTIYQVVVSSIKLGWHWKGTEEFVRNSPTFVFDGIEDTLRLTDTLTARCPYCWVFIFEFDSSQADYGDRTGQMLTLITHHRAVITVEQLEIMSAVMDDKWVRSRLSIRDSCDGETPGSRGRRVRTWNPHSRRRWGAEPDALTYFLAGCGEAGGGIVCYFVGTLVA